MDGKAFISEGTKKILNIDKKKKPANTNRKNKS